jgi:hypothetical protein
MGIVGANIGASGSAGGGVGVGGAGGAEAQEKLRREYEYKIATMQSRIAGLEGDYLGRKGEREKKENW